MTVRAAHGEPAAATAARRRRGVAMMTPGSVIATAGRKSDLASPKSDR